MFRIVAATTRLSTPLGCQAAMRKPPAFNLASSVSPHGIRGARPQTLYSSRNRHYIRRFQYEYYGSRGGGDRDKLAFYWIIGMNVLVYFNWQYGFPFSRPTLHDYFIATTWGVFGKDKNIMSLLGAAFSHIEGYHLLANMLTFYFFGRDVFLTLGRRFALPMYLIAGVAASYAQVWQGRRHGYNAQVLGASGAVSAFVIFSILANPGAVVLLWFFVPVPAALFGIAYIMQDIWGVSHRQTYRGAFVGHEAHLAGSAVGGIAYFMARRRFMV